MLHNHTFSLDIGWQPLLKDLGVHPKHVLRRACLAEDLLSRPGQNLSTEAYFRFWRALEQEVNDPLFPVRIVNAVSTESFSPPIFAALCSTNLMQAVQRLAKYKQLVAPMSLDVAVADNGELTVAPRWLLAESTVPQSLMVAEIAFFVRLARMATREPVQTVHTTLPASLDSPDMQVYAPYFGTQLKRGPAPSVTFTVVDALRPFLTFNEGMWRVFEPDLRRRLDELDTTATTADRVGALLLELLPGNAASIDVVAKRLMVSKRTLQRRLEEEGQNFRALVNSTREKLARHYLKSTHLSGAEIAFLLGFEDPNSFYRAFQEWTGHTPETVRHHVTLN